MSKVKELESKIMHYAQLYYDGKNTITDAEFDSLVDQLKELDPNNVILHATGWGYVVPDDERKVNHPMVNVGGLGKHKVDPSTIIQFKSATPKYDGASVELIFSDNQLVSAITRGNGETGQRVTDHLVPIVGTTFIKNEDKYPKEFIDWLKSITISISGEFILSKTSWKKNYPDDISHRNIPSGFLNRREVTDEECKVFSFVPYRINAIQSNDLSFLKNLDDRAKIQELLNSQFDCNVPYTMLSKSVSYEEQLELFEKRSDYNFDGIVANNSDHIDFEYSVDPNNSSVSKVIFKYDEIAYKIITETADVTVTGIDWNLTRTARLVPTIKYNPVELSGAMCERATGHNAKNIIDNGIDTGAIIRITRSGEVIPYVLEVLNPVYSDKKYICPSCNHKLTLDGADLKCNNPDCVSKNYNRVLQWLSYLGWIKNAGGSLYDSMIEYGDLSCVDDLYTKDIDWSGMINLDGMGESKMKLVYKIIEKIHQPMQLSWILVGSNLKGISSSSADKLEKESNLKECIINNTPDKFTTNNVKGLGWSVYKTIIDNWDRLVRNCSFVELIDSNAEEESIVDTNRLKISVTGKLEYGTRSKLFTNFKDKLQEVDLKDAEYLVTNNPNSGSSKNRNAQALGVKIITEKELFNIIK